LEGTLQLNQPGSRPAIFVARGISEREETFRRLKGFGVRELGQLSSLLLSQCRACSLPLPCPGLLLSDVWFCALLAVSEPRLDPLD
jgi:hypothetical protein